jgi:leader peptidase (prepilin peptidase)/N-methyltransferase
MIEILSLACLAAALMLLIALSVIDLRTLLLPDKLVLPFALLGIAFHATTGFHYITAENMAVGCILGGGLLYLIRTVANFIYKTDTLGLGDVKLLAAAGLWLGPEGTVIALITGAMAGIVHGLLLATYSFFKTRALPDMSRFSLPAGPGFAVGIVIAAAYVFKDIIKVAL